MRRRICYIHHIPMPGPEANTVNVSKMCSAFAANDCDVTLAVVPGAPRARLNAALRDHYALSHAFDVTPLPALAARPTLSALAGLAAARRTRADLVYTRTPHAALAACAAGFDAALEIHTDLDSFSPLARAATLRAARSPRLKAIVAISEALAAHIRMRAPAAAVIVAHDGADAMERPPQDPCNTHLTAGFIGRPYRGKGLELIVRLAGLCPWAHFEIVGATQAQACALAGCEAPGNIVFHGAVPHAETARYITSWDVVLAPYQRHVIVADGRTDAARWMSPLKVFEYMAAGKPILASNLPVLREILTHDETALLLDPDDCGLWAAALANLQDKEIRKRLGACAQALFLARYTWRARAAHILSHCG